MDDRSRLYDNSLTDLDVGDPPFDDYIPLQAEGRESQPNTQGPDVRQEIVQKACDELIWNQDPSIPC